MTRLAALLLCLGVATRLAAQEPEAVLVELQLGRIAARTVDAYRLGDDALLPVSAFFSLAELKLQRLPDSSLEAVVQPGNVSLVLDPARQQVRLGKSPIRLLPGELMTRGTETYLSTRVLGRALSLEWQVSWPDLQVTVLDPGSLPLARRIRREAFLDARLASATRPAYTGLQLGLERPRLDGLVLDYSVLTPTTGVDGAAYSTMLGLDVFGGSFALGLQSQAGAGRSPRAEVSWNGIWRENPWLSQVRIGDGFATGPRSRTLRGVALSNSPFTRPSILGQVPFSGQLGQGWTVEAYRGGRLIGFDSVNALGQFSFDVPIQYGENPVDFVAYGPFGEVREFDRTYRVLNDGLPARRFEYGVSAGQCRTDLCSASGNVDLRYGLSTRWTARAGVDQFWRDSLGSLTHPYIGISGSPTNAILVEGEAVGAAVLRGAARFEPSVNLQLGAEVTRFDRGVPAPILTPEGRISQVTLNAFLRPASALGGMYLDASVDRIHAEFADLTSARLGGSLQFSELRVLPSVRVQTTSGAGPRQTQTFFGFNTFLLPYQELGGILGRVTTRTSLELEAGQGVSSASAYFGFPLLRGLRSELGTAWFRGMHGPTFSLLIAAELPTVRSYTTVSAGGGHEALGTQYVSGSAIYNPSRGDLDFSGSPGLARGGLTGQVFLDRNGNGHRDAGEELLPGVRVVVGPDFSVTDSSGTFRVWDLTPYEPTMIAVDTASLSSPLWVPAYAAATVEPSPNRYRSFDIPILPAGVLEGQVVSPSGRPTAGVPVVLRHKKSGERRVVTTFSDGAFYVLGVRPGEWELTVDPKCLEALNATAEALTVPVPADPDGAEISGLRLELR